MVGDAAHRGAGALGQGHAQDRGCGARVLKKHFIEIPEAEQQDHAIRQLRFDAPVLAHHRGQLFTSHGTSSSGPVISDPIGGQFRMFARPPSIRFVTRILLCHTVR